jgi:hypothetical protein
MPRRQLGGVTIDGQEVLGFQVGVVGQYLLL